MPAQTECHACAVPQRMSGVAQGRGGGGTATEQLVFCASVAAASGAASSRVLKSPCAGSASRAAPRGCSPKGLTPFQAAGTGSVVQRLWLAPAAQRPLHGARISPCSGLRHLFGLDLSRFYPTDLMLRTHLDCNHTSARRHAHYTDVVVI
jgi:hypothetical protein